MSILGTAAIVWLLVLRSLVGSLEDHAVAVSHHDATHINGPIAHHVPGRNWDYLRTGERFVRRLVAERRISYVKLGKYVRLQRSTLDAFIEAGRVPCD